MDLTLLARERVGKVLRGKYHLDRLIDVGGMAAVYEATHRNGTRSAIKVLHPKYVSDVQARTRFLREGYAANHVGHPGSVTVIDDDFTEDGEVYLVMELLDGESLESCLARERVLQPLDVLEGLGIGLPGVAHDLPEGPGGTLGLGHPEPGRRALGAP